MIKRAVLWVLDQPSRVLAVKRVAAVVAAGLVVFMVGSVRDAWPENYQKTCVEAGSEFGRELFVTDRGPGWSGRVSDLAVGDVQLDPDVVPHDAGAQLTGATLGDGVCSATYSVAGAGFEARFVKEGKQWRAQAWGPAGEE